MQNKRYGLFVNTKRGYEEALEAVKAALKSEGMWKCPRL